MDIQNNGVTAVDFILRVGVDDGTKLTAQTTYKVSQWVGRAFLKVKPYEENTFGPWRIVWTDDYDEDEYPYFDVLVHYCYDWDLPRSEDGFLITGFKAVRKEFNAAVVESALRSEPAPEELSFVNKIGISGVPEAIMAKHWWYAVGGEDEYMKKSMLYADMTNAIREQSFDFGWKNYPFTDNPDGDISYADLA